MRDLNISYSQVGSYNVGAFDLHFYETYIQYLIKIAFHMYNVLHVYIFVIPVKLGQILDLLLHLILRCQCHQSDAMSVKRIKMIRLGLAGSLFITASLLRV